MGHEVHVITSDRIFPFKNVSKMLSDIGSAYKDRMRPVGDEGLEGFTIHRKRARFEVLYDLIVYEGIAEELKRIRPDVVHAHGAWQWGTYIAARNKGRLGYKLVIDEHGYSTTYDQAKTARNWALDKEYRLLRAPFARYSIARCDGTVAVSAESERFLREFYGVKNARTIPLGIDHRRFYRDEAARKRVRDDLGIRSGLLLVTAGRMERAKRTELFIEGLKRAGDGVKLIIVGQGDGAYMNELKASSDDRVLFVGFKDQKGLSALYSACDIGLWGKASITIREAMGCSLPLILLDTPDMASLLKWDNGIACPPTPEGVADAIRRMSDPERRRRMGENGRRAVVEDLSVRKEASDLLGFYTQLIG
jgi:glycosyltransferase involved in cell wall biosynthesis